MSDAYSIETAAKEHLNAIPAIEQAAAAMFAEADLPAELRYRVTGRGTLGEAQKRGRLWVALAADRRPVGFALADIIDGQAHLEEMDVHTAHARRGLGTRLVNTVIEWARQEKRSSLSLVTFRHVPWNAPFYEKMGFEVLDQSEIGPELSSLLDEERDAGLDSRNRVAMKVSL